MSNAQLVEKDFLRELRNMAEQLKYTVSYTGDASYDNAYETGKQGAGEDLENLLRKYEIWHP